MAHFEIQNLTFSFPNSTQNALQNISLSVERGQFVLLCGQSGCGKTTLLRHLQPALTPHGNRSGKILFDGSPNIGFVMQDPDDQIVTDKVWHELAFGLENLGVDPTVMRLRVAEMANYFGIQNWFHRDTALLSGGEKQLLNLASIMVMQPEILILDEPTAQLDPIAAADFLSTVRKINQELGTTILISEHRLEEVYPAADRVIVMQNGQILTDGTPKEASQTLHSQNAAMFCALPTPIRVFYDSGAKGTPPMTVREGRSWLAQQGKRQASALNDRKFHSAQAALELKNIWFRYEKDSPDILKGTEANIPSGCLFALLGGNGSGKSTLLKSICAVCKPYRGSIRLFGKDLKKYKNKELFQNGISMLPQDPKSLFSRNTVREELAEMSAAKIDEISKLCEISEFLDRHPYDLSGGEQQRVALAKILLTRPRLLLLDEPTKGLDNDFKQRFADILCKLKSQQITIFMVSHDIEFCAQHADFVSMFFDGQLLATAAPQRFFSENSFYTTAAKRMSHGIFPSVVTVRDLVALCRQTEEKR